MSKHMPGPQKFSVRGHLEIRQLINSLIIALPIIHPSVHPIFFKKKKLPPNSPSLQLPPYAHPTLHAPINLGLAVRLRTTTPADQVVSESVVWRKGAHAGPVFAGVDGPEADSEGGVAAGVQA